MKFRIWVNGKRAERRLSRKVTGRLQKLPYGHSLYFDLSGPHETYRTGELLAAHAVEERIVSAFGLMSDAAARKTKKRSPITIKREGKQLIIVDGSSTFLNALFSKWPDVPCVVEVASQVSTLPATTKDVAPTLEAARAAVERHMTYNRDNYLELLEAVTEAIEKIDEDPRLTTIADHYSRSRKQGVQKEFKEPGKIVLKYYEAVQKNPKFKVEDIIDIVGATVIVYYPDQIEMFLDRFQLEAKIRGLSLEPYRDADTGRETLTKVHREKGYHATHVKIRSEAVDKAGLRIELQIKTMLHDAWGAKMHDLTYKPTGELDPRLKTLMESFGDSLQAIEVQSQTLRDAIQVRVDLMRTLTRTARQQLMARLNEQDVVEAARKTYRAVLDRIKSGSERLAVCPALDEELREILKSIRELEESGVTSMERLKLYTFLASFREDRILDRTIDDALNKWSSENKDEIHGIFVRAAALHQTNRVADAIGLIKSFFGGHPINAPTAVLACNLANYIIETNLERPGIDPSARDQVRDLLSRIEPFTEEMEASAHLDTKGAFLIVFGEDGEIDEGLRLIDEATKMAEPNDQGMGYFELYKSYGWKRKLRL
ncbi:RelA/SpoT domain-containing protein [Bradyrhizobium sp. AUGA SZCCT0176]|uniref:RelA/SpoT domain-containing protein n=1 Tax=unclassified Bradyrhizobium TaxID=2631580 RepID=UPI001BADAB20|nr:MULTISPECIES: RelA/SpoT domain-containing protein [unclassified Bradyrhizobium]MBR1225205.1 RelA/SpoT domain-containing protein [Bradyrhizobium sp. AUGA SZCCT0176]MBR1281294.1 RelA/SpoT domain-containing protein [Bradyrhizobium sp. AUGA SZCCT0177]